MQTIVQAHSITVNFGKDSYATIDKEQGVVTIHEGQRLGLDTDWGGRIVAALTIEQAEAIANALYVPWSQPDEVYKSATTAEYRDDYIGA
jgi:hypothetical protein